MPNIAYVDWDGLVYYDSKIKQYISDVVKHNITFGGIFNYASLPDPSQNNLHYLYKITDAFISAEDRFDIVDTFTPGTCVLCIQTETKEFKYTVLGGNIDYELLYTKAQIDDLFTQLKKDIKNEYISYDEMYSSEIIIECGDSHVEDESKEIIEYIQDNQLPVFSGTSENIEPEPWEQIDLDNSSYNEIGYYSEQGRFGYQLSFEGNDDLVPQTFAIPQGSKIVAAYRYDLGGLNQWLPQEVPPSMEWIESETTTLPVKDEHYIYQTFTYDVGTMGSAMIDQEYWRFDIGG